MELSVEKLSLNVTTSIRKHHLSPIEIHFTDFSTVINENQIELITFVYLQ